ncbi:MAG: type II secretion system protein [Sulfuricurvum sp.]
MNKHAFTMIELIFVIVILGILAAVALPRFGGAKTSADLSRIKADATTIRAAIANERASQVIKGERSYIPKLNDNDADPLFTGVGNRQLLPLGIKSGTGSGQWQKSSNGKTFTAKVGDDTYTFTYYDNNGSFKCTSGNKCNYFNN